MIENMPVDNWIEEHYILNQKSTFLLKFIIITKYKCCLFLYVCIPISILNNKN